MNIGSFYVGGPGLDFQTREIAKLGDTENER